MNALDLLRQIEKALSELRRLAQAGDKPARARLATEYALLAGDRLLLAAKAGAIRDRQLRAHLDVHHPDEQARCVYAFHLAVHMWLPTISPDHRPDPHNVARRYADDLTALATAIDAKGHKAGYLGLSLDEDNRRVSRNGKTADFAGQEIPWRLLSHMHRRKDSYASQQDLLRAGWSEEDVVTPETVQRHISTIRSLLRRLAVEVQTQRNVGYRLTAQSIAMPVCAPIIRGRTLASTRPRKASETVLTSRSQPSRQSGPRGPGSAAPRGKKSPVLLSGGNPLHRLGRRLGVAETATEGLQGPGAG